MAMSCYHDRHLRNLFIALSTALLSVSTVVLCGEALAEQTSSWKIAGIVRDSANSPIPNASVYLEKSGGSRLETTTDKAGKILRWSPRGGAYFVLRTKAGVLAGGETTKDPPRTTRRSLFMLAT